MHLRELVDRAGGALVGVGALADDPAVRSVVTTDLLDPRRYLTGGELVLTGLAWWRPDQPGRSRGFVAALVGAGVAALAAGEAEFGDIPGDLIEACAEAGLPLLRVPVAYSFATVTDRVTRQITGGDGLMGVLTRQRSLVAAVAALAARDRGPAVLAEVLSLVTADLGLRCWVLSPTGRLVAGDGEHLGERERQRLARAHVTSGSLAGPRSVTAVPADVARAVAWLLVVEQPADPAMIDELASLVALEREVALRRPEPDDALAAALAGTNVAEVSAAHRRCGFEADVPGVVVVGEGEWSAAVIGEALDGHPAPWVVGVAGAATYGVLATADAGEVVRRLTATVELVGPGLGSGRLRVGVSDPVTGPAGLLAAVAEARAVAATGAGRYAVAGPDRLASSALLLAAVPPELRRAYVGRVLGPLLEHDRAHRTDLVTTLRTYLDCSGSWARCAERMHLHVNTLRYRVERIEALTGRDLRRLDDQVDLLAAVRLCDAGELGSGDAGGRRSGDA